MTQDDGGEPSSAPDSPDPAVIGALRQTYGFVVHTWKAHEKSRELEVFKANLLKFLTVTLIAATTGSALTSIFSDHRVLLLVTDVLSFLATGLTVFQMSFAPDEVAHQHRSAAKELWYVREHLVALLAEVRDTPGTVETSHALRDVIQRLRLLHTLAPNIPGRAYLKATKALREQGEMSFRDGEIDSYLPPDLRRSPPP